MPGRPSRNKTRRRDHESRSRSGTPPMRNRTSRRRSRTSHRGRENDTAMQTTLNSILLRLDSLESGSTRNHSNVANSINLLTSSDAEIASANHTNVQPNGILSAVCRLETVEDSNVSQIATNNLEQSKQSPTVTQGNVGSIDKPDVVIGVKATSSKPNNDMVASTSTQALADAIRALNPLRSHNYYVSNFDPSVHDIDTWCQEVERAKAANGWDSYECLSRVSACLKGDAKHWLNEWVCNDRSWSNFVKEFKPLCPRRLDYANILFETMNSSSDTFVTYAEYARRTLMRLRIVKGLSEELMIQIAIRGITDPQVRAAAANANLTCDNLVSFLSIYTKPRREKRDLRNSTSKKRSFPCSQTNRSNKCFVCDQAGHKSFACPKKPKLDSNTETSSSEIASKLCAFCKKPGHTEKVCFAKNRSDPRNKRNVNLCSDK
ncbi:uncharacterized protein [Choristoneura fumiferana]|uniref:uncharacterized protein n=1 Tax=Choristoneura fumiferana TaxID=7141 RepID=UPI003D15E222